MTPQNNPIDPFAQIMLILDSSPAAKKQVRQQIIQIIDNKSLLRSILTPKEEICLISCLGLPLIIEDAKECELPEQDKISSGRKKGYAYKLKWVDPPFDSERPELGTFSEVMNLPAYKGKKQRGK